jgi:hypothetical protein
VKGHFQANSGHALKEITPDDPDDHPERLLESAKWFLWQGNVHQSLQRIDTLIELIEHDEHVPEGPKRRKLARALNELYDYLESNSDLIPDYGDRRRHGEAISSSIAESTVNQVISRRFVKKQQMRWQPDTAHLLLRVRTRTLNGKLRETFQHWWPAMTSVSAPALSWSRSTSQLDQFRWFGLRPPTRPPTGSREVHPARRTRMPNALGNRVLPQSVGEAE